MTYINGKLVATDAISALAGLMRSLALSFKNQKIKKYIFKKDPPITITEDSCALKTFLNMHC